VIGTLVASLSFSKVIAHGAVLRVAIDEKELRRLDEIADRLETRERIEVKLSQMGADEQRRCVEEERAAIGR